MFSSCLQSGDYMQAKNALLALNRCVKVRGWAGPGWQLLRNVPAVTAAAVPTAAPRSCSCMRICLAAAPTTCMHTQDCGGLLLCLQVYPATKLDASKLIDILAPMR